MVRSGDEPMHARSPLRLRLALVAFGFAVAMALGVRMWTAGQPAAALVAAAAALGAVVNGVVVLRRMRAGPHYQPGRDVPPYRPVTDGPAADRGSLHSRVAVSERTRQRRYLALMAVCLALVTLAWVWVRLVSVTAAVIMSLVAMVIPPLAAIVANVGWSDPDEEASRRSPDSRPSPDSRRPPRTPSGG